MLATADRRPRRPGTALLLLALGFAALAATAYASYRGLLQVVVHATARADALQTQVLLERLGTLLVDIESGQRGFVITGEESFLEPYWSARRALRATQDALAAQVAASPAEFDATRLVVLDGLVERRLSHAERIVAQRRTLGDAALKDLAGYFEGKRLMDELRAELGRLRQAEARVVERRAQQVAEVERRAAQLGAALSVAALVFFALAVGLQQRERRRRDEAELALRELNATLESQVAARTAELGAALARIRAFAGELDRSIEAERRRLAREVHDQFGQITSAIKLRVQALRQASPPTDAATVDGLLGLVDQSLQTARRIASALRPPLLDDLGLAAAVQHLLEPVAREGGPQCEVHIDDAALLGPEQANQLFRIVQEATTNVLRHAQARQLHLYGWEEDGVYCLDIDDDGHGPGPERPGGQGLRNMRERAALAGGTLAFGPGPDGGSRVSVRLPLRPDLETPR